MAWRILILAANPRDTSRLRLDQEVREIDIGLQRSQQREEFVIKQQWAVRPKDIRRAVLDFRPNIVHFCGHGEGGKGIAFEDEVGNTKLVSASALAGFFELFADRIRCVILNACYSEIQASAIVHHIDYVIGMREGIADNVAIEFAVAFYDALGAGKSLEFAYKLACNAIQWESVSGHLTPILKSNKDSTELATIKPTPNMTDLARIPERQQRGQWLLVLSATVNEIDNELIESLVAHLREISGDSSLTLQKIESGSVKLFFEGSREGFERIHQLFSEGQLNSISGKVIESIRWGALVKLNSKGVTHPTLVIGLGGTGDKVVRSLKQQIQSSIHNSESVQLLVVDTEPIQNWPGKERLNLSEYSYIGGYNTSHILANLDRHPAIRQWWPVSRIPKEPALYNPGALHHSARASRLLGRLSFFAKYSEFTSRLGRSLSYLNEPNIDARWQHHGETRTSNELIRVYIVSSLSGGTGAGIFLDVALKLRAELGEHAFISAFFALPSIFNPMLASVGEIRRSLANTYASLIELNYYANTDRLGEAWLPDKVVHDIERPLNQIYFVERGVPGKHYYFSEDMFQTIANGVYYDATTPIPNISEEGQGLPIYKSYTCYYVGADGIRKLHDLKNLPNFEEYQSSYNDLVASGQVLYTRPEVWENMTHQQ